MAGASLNRGAYNRGMQQAGRRWAHRVGNDVVNAAKVNCPVDEGTLRASITYVTRISSTGAKVIVGSPLPYAEYFHTGTGIYGPRGTPIVPVTKKALKFKWDGPGGATRSKDKRGYVFAKSVKGIRPNPFLADALADVMGDVQRRTT
ncbi:HK97 gp10 family phage protein [Gordonia sp. PDNC005]|uniref:HK97 gp10 family phage protein n=1 Tax=Gordonia sp. PDNC005 TaxID=2811424 RepID=UPI0019644BCF|nr:HK97 gp10 family phage protein [Gordonia sp. PDNC005]QRY62755.1 HK97 gp10 family phage protein [Gordonia sp. PDNC005]